jgi:hypothetical protein
LPQKEERPKWKRKVERRKNKMGTPERRKNIPEKGKRKGKRDEVKNRKAVKVQFCISKQ